MCWLTVPCHDAQIHQGCMTPCPSVCGVGVRDPAQAFSGWRAAVADSQDRQATAGAKARGHEVAMAG